MNRWFRYITYAFATIGVLFVALTLYGNFKDCQKVQVRALSSPDGVWRAVHYLEYCESNGKNESVVWLESESSRYPTLRMPGTTTEIEFSWLNDRKLRVTYPDSAAAEQFYGTEGVKVEYRVIGLESHR